MLHGGVKDFVNECFSEENSVLCLLDITLLLPWLIAIYFDLAEVAATPISAAIYDRQSP